MTNITVKATAFASQPLIAFHGFTDNVNRTLPVDTLFCTLEGLETKVELLFDEHCSKTHVTYEGKEMPEEEVRRITTFINSVLIDRNIPPRYRLSCHSNIPHARGLGASSALFAALTAALCKALGTHDVTKMSKLARLGSISAANSIVGGVSMLLCDENTPWAKQLLLPKDFPFITLCFPVDETRPSLIRHLDAAQSPLYPSFIEASRKAAEVAINAIQHKNFEMLHQIIERQMLFNIATISTGKSMDPMWRPLTVELYLRLRKFRAETGANLFFAQSSGYSAYCYVHEDSYNQVARYLSDAGYSWILAKPGGHASAILTENERA